MTKENYHKIKLLKLFELLYQNTDEEHPLSTAEICSRVVQQCFNVDRRTLADDIETLNNYGYEIIGCRGSMRKLIM
jgi:DNA-directed RNA polymerase specialized sigma54-like protein